MRTDIPHIPFKFILISSLKIVTTSICKIPPDLPLPALGRENIPKGGITLLWPPAHRASLRGMSPSGAEPGPEGKEG